jgi:hypothetical protein
MVLDIVGFLASMDYWEQVVGVKYCIGCGYERKVLVGGVEYGAGFWCRV